MRTHNINGYDIECSGVRGSDSVNWLAFLAIMKAGSNPMHRNRIFPYQQVCVERVFTSEDEAEQAALQFAQQMIKT